jgi:SAM-dependent methyltransferase
MLGDSLSGDVDISLTPEKNKDNSVGMSFSAIDRYAASFLRDWLAGEEIRQRSAGSYYMQRLAHGDLFVESELAIAEYCRDRFDASVKFFELGFGFGELSLLLALSGFSATGYESDTGRYAGATALMDALAHKDLDLGKLSLIEGRFPDALKLEAMGAASTALVATNVTSSYVKDNMDYVHRAMRLFDHVIVDLSRLGVTRDRAARQDLIADLQKGGLADQGIVYAAGDTDIRHFQRRGSAGTTAISMPERLRYSDIGKPVPSRLLTSPCFVFHELEIPIEAIFPRLETVPDTWRPETPLRIAAVRGPWKSDTPAASPTFRDGKDGNPSHFVFPHFGGYRVECSFGVFKCLLLDPAAGKDKQALEIFRFATENIVHSSIDRPTISPWGTRTRYIRPDLLLHKLFLSDQPLGLHCDSAAEVTGYLLHLNGYLVREIWLVDPQINSGHVVLEVFLPERGEWIMLDPDFGVVVTDRTGVPLGTADIVDRSERKRDLAIDRVVAKHWARGSFDVAEAYTGQLAWHVDAYSGGETVRGDSYYDMMDRLFRVRRVMSYRFEDGFDDIRSQPVETNGAGGSDPVFATGPLSDGATLPPAGHLASSAAPPSSKAAVVPPEAGPARLIAKTALPPVPSLPPVADAALPKAAPTSQTAATEKSDESMDRAMTSNAFDPFTVFKNYFKLVGPVKLDKCPVCESRRITQIWRLPQSRLDGKTYLSAPGKAHNNTYLDYLPLLKVPQEVYGFDMCGDCHSIFRNPKDDDQEIYKRDSSKVRSFKEHGLDPFRGAAATCEAFFPPDTRFVVDAACGSGQMLAIYKEKRPELRLFGLELSAPSVEWMKELGIEAAVVDLDLDDLDKHVAPGTVDFIVFNEAFEHVRSPLRVLRKMFRMLRPGGRIHFTAQYFGPENSLQIRVGEPIYIDRYGLDWVISQLGAELVHLAADIKYRVTLAKAA